MSVENHPNINAAGFAIEIIVGFRKHLRGKAKEDQARSLDILHESGLEDFVTLVSEQLDSNFKDFPRTKPPQRRKRENKSHKSRTKKTAS